MWAIWSLFGGKVEETKGEEEESKEDVEGDDAEEDPGEVGDVVGELPIWTKRVIKTVEVTRSSRGSDDGSDTGSMHSGTSTVTTTTSVEEIVLAGDYGTPENPARRPGIIPFTTVPIYPGLADHIYSKALVKGWLSRIDKVYKKRSERWCAIYEAVLYEFEPDLGEMHLMNKVELVGAMVYIPQYSKDTFVVTQGGMYCPYIEDTSVQVKKIDICYTVDDPSTLNDWFHGVAIWGVLEAFALTDGGRVPHLIQAEIDDRERKKRNQTPTIEGTPSQGGSASGSVSKQSQSGSVRSGSSAARVFAAGRTIRKAGDGEKDGNGGKIVQVGRQAALRRVRLDKVSSDAKNQGVVASTGEWKVSEWLQKSVAGGGVEAEGFGGAAGVDQGLERVEPEEGLAPVKGLAAGGGVDDTDGHDDGGGGGEKRGSGSPPPGEEGKNEGVGEGGRAARGGKGGGGSEAGGREGSSVGSKSKSARDRAREGSKGRSKKV